MASTLEYTFRLFDDDLDVDIDGDSITICERDADQKIIRQMSLTLNDFDMLAANVAAYRNMRAAGKLD